MPKAQVITYLKNLCRIVPDFPCKGVNFVDLTPVFLDPNGLSIITDGLIELSTKLVDLKKIDFIAGIDARGFVVGSALALKLGIGFLAVRKAGKLPPPVYHESYKIEYNDNREIEIPSAAVSLVGRNILIVDDVLATAGTALACKRLLEKAGALVAGMLFVIEIKDLIAETKLVELPYGSLLKI